MKYPEDFKNRVKKAYPDDKKLNEWLDKGKIIVGSYLEHHSSTVISVPIDKILEAISLEDLKKEAKEAKEKVELYEEWRELYLNSTN